MQRFYKGSCVIWVVGLLVMSAGQAEAGFITVPNALAAVEGNGVSQFLTGDARATSVRYQQVFAASQFSGAGTITEIAFRPDATFGVPFSATLSNTRIALSTTSRTPDGLSATFANNVGLDEVVVFSGDLTLSSADAPGPGGTRVFDILISLSTPFAYDPSQGDLLLDFQRDASTLRVSFDGHDQAGDSISRAFGSRSSATANFGVDTFGLVARFNVTPAPAVAVPEPASAVMLSTGIACLMGFGWRRRAKASAAPGTSLSDDVPEA
jgi:hypothetical protein